MRALLWFLGSMVVVAVAFTSSALGVGANARVTQDDTAASYLRYDGSSDADVHAEPEDTAPSSRQPARTEVAAARPAPSRVRRATGMRTIVTAGPQTRHLTRPNVDRVGPIGQQVVTRRTR